MFVLRNINSLDRVFFFRPTMVAWHCFLLKCSSLYQALHWEIHGSRMRAISMEARLLERADAWARRSSLDGGGLSSLCVVSRWWAASGVPASPAPSVLALQRRQLSKHTSCSTLSSQTWSVKLHEHVIRSSFAEDDHVLVEGLLK